MRVTKSSLWRVVWSAVVLGIAAGVAGAHADEDRYTATNPAWAEECGSCHVAYPPALLPAESWRVLMAQLDRHFGTDASVDAQTGKEITAFLEASAGGRRQSRGGATPLRITETRWFVNEHDEVPARVWKSAANCEACHTRAAQGDFSERTLAVPR